jgi:hypothetical protein
VRSYLLSLEEVFAADAARTSQFPARTKPLEEISAWPLH